MEKLQGFSNDNSNGVARKRDTYTVLKWTLKTREAQKHRAKQRLQQPAATRSANPYGIDNCFPGNVRVAIKYADGTAKINAMSVATTEV
jgi:hypothetical protein